jgi:hypothetical protein
MFYLNADMDKPLCRASGNITYLDKQRCDMLQAGHIHRTFHKWTTLSGSLGQLLDAVHSIPIIHFWESSLGYGNRHPLCSWVPKMRTEVNIILAAVNGLSFPEFPSRKRGVE